MKPSLKILPLLLLFVHVQVTAQNRSLLNYISGDQNLVMQVDPVRLALKIPKETFKQSGLYRELMKHPGSPIARAFNDPSTLGVDLLSGLVVAGKQKISDGDEDILIAVYGKIRDYASFDKFISDCVKSGESNIETYGTDRLFFNDDRLIVAWNKDVFVFTNGNSRDMFDEYTVVPDTVSTDEITNDYKELKLKLRKVQRDLAFELLSPKQNGMGSERSLVELLNTPGDIRIWSNGFSNPIPQNLMMVFGGYPELLKDLAPGIKTAVINFENGKIVSHGKTFPSPELAAILEKNEPAATAQDLIARLPEGKLLGIANLSQHSAITRMIYEKPLFKMIRDSLQPKISFDLKTLPEVFKHELMVAVIKAGGSKKPELFLAMRINDYAKFQDLASAIKKLIDETRKQEEKDKEEGVTVTNIFGEKLPVVKFDEKLVVFSLSEAAAEAFLKSTGTHALPEWIEKKESYPIQMGIDFNAVLSLALTSAKEGKSNMGGLEKSIIESFGQVLVYGGKYENGAIHSTFEFTFSNQEENALKQLFNLINAVIERTNEEVKSEDNPGSKSKVKVTEVTLQEIRQEEQKVEPPPPPPPYIAPPKVEMKPAPKKKE